MKHSPHGQSNISAQVNQDALNFFEANLIAPWVAQYVQMIMAQAGLTDLDTDFKLEYIERLSLQVQRKVGNIIMGALDDRGMEALVDVMQAQSPDEQSLKKFMAEYLPDYEARLEQGLLAFGQQFVARAHNLRGHFQQQSHQQLAAEEAVGAAQ